MQLKNVQKFRSVAERDIDMLFLEEFNVSTEFSSWFYSKVTGKSGAPGCDGAWHSVSDSTLGESDLLVSYEDGSAILMENKIDAVVQPNQAHRYDLRGEKGIVEGHWKSYKTCMVAPLRYLEKEADSQHYDVCISYESVRDWFVKYSLDEKRADYKALVVEEAIKQNRRGYQPVTDLLVTRFWSDYWQLATRDYPALEMKKPGNKPSNADWPAFRPQSLSVDANIVHKLRRGVVDLQLAGAAGDLAEIEKQIKDSDFQVVIASKSAAIRIEVTPVDRHQPFHLQKAAIEEGLQAATRLLNFGWQFDLDSDAVNNR